MANDIGKAMARLKHRDIRTRRRAVRTLFEHDDPSVLEAFKPLLDDNDTWFVSKALDAYRMWGVLSGSEAVQTLLTHRNLDVRRAGANLLTPLGDHGVPLALSALNDEDSVVQRKAARALLLVNDASVTERLAQHESDAIRTTGMSHPALDESALRKGLSDAHEGVRLAALNSALKRNIALNLDDLIPFLEAGHHTVNILIWAAEHEPTQLERLMQHIKAKDVKALGDHLRATVDDHADPLIQHLLNGGMLEPVARWVIRQGASEDDLRWQLINDERLHVIERCKLLERLIGRAHEPGVIEHVERLSASTEEELLKVACENLSTAASEVGA